MPPSPTQPSTLSGMGNEYHPKCGDALQLGSRGRYGFGYGNVTQKLLWFEITKMLIAVLTIIFIVLFIIIFCTLSLPIPEHLRGE